MAPTATEEVVAAVSDEVPDWRPASEPADDAEAELRRQQETTHVAGVADARWKTRRRRILNDRHMDPRRRNAYLDRTLIDLGQCATLLGLSTHRISEARGGRQTGRGGVPRRLRQWPHPSVFPPPARIRDFVAGRPVHQWYRGEVIEWAEQRGLNLLNLNTGELMKMRDRSGRPRLPRTTLSKQPKPDD